MKNSKTARNAEIAGMFEDGFTLNDIARQFGISKQRVSIILHALGLSADEEFTTAILEEPYIVAVDFGDEASRLMIEWSHAKLLPPFDEIIQSSLDTVNVDLRRFSNLEHVVAYVPCEEAVEPSGREIKSNWLVYAYPIREARISFPFDAPTDHSPRLHQNTSR